MNQYRNRGRRMPQRSLHYNDAIILLSPTIIFFCAAWFLTPYTAKSISQAYDMKGDYHVNNTINRLKARKQLQMQYSRHYNINNNNNNKAPVLHHSIGKLLVPIPFEITMIPWIRQLRLSLMVGI